MIAKLDATNGQLTLAQSRADEFSRAWRNAQAEVEKLQMELAAAKNGQITTGLVAGGLSLIAGLLAGAAAASRDCDKEG